MPAVTVTAVVGVKRRGSAGLGSGRVYKCGRQWRRSSDYEHQGSCAAANGSGHRKRRAQLRSAAALSGARGGSGGGSGGSGLRQG